MLVLLSSATPFLHSASASPSWMNSSWTDRREITISNSGAALVDYQVKITVTFDPAMNADFSDLRFTSDDGVTPISFWVESFTPSSSAVVWVKVPSIPASSSALIYMYYGNPIAESASDGKATFNFYDGFETPTSSAWSTKLSLPEFT